jgi:hypothetical protein
MKRSWPNFKVLSRHSTEGMRKTTKNLSQDSFSTGRNLNPRPSEYEAGVLTARPRRSVRNSYEVSVLKLYISMFKECFPTCCLGM